MEIFLTGLLAPIIFSITVILLIIIIYLIAYIINVIINIFIYIQTKLILFYYKLFAFNIATRNSFIFENDIIENLINNKNDEIIAEYEQEKGTIIKNYSSTNEDFINSYKNNIHKLCNTIKEKIIKEKAVKKGKFLFWGTERAYDIRQIYILNGIPVGKKYLVEESNSFELNTQELFEIIDKINNYVLSPDILSNISNKLSK